MKTVHKRKPSPAETARATFDPTPPPPVSSAAPQPEVRVVLEQARAPPVRLLSRKEVLERVGLTYPTLWAWMQKGDFPRARDLGGKIAWIESEIEKWINELPIRQFKADGVDHE
jgi:predicted DNA-binding transcriptional regulator AlpA